MIEQIKFERFTAFENFSLSFSPGINIFIGENGTGKTHLLKAVYAACEVSKSQKQLAEKVNSVFLPSDRNTGRLINRKTANTAGSFEITRRVAGLDEQLSIGLSIQSRNGLTASGVSIADYNRWLEYPLECVYIPVKDMMANAPGFRSLYSLRHIHFEEVYADIIDRAFLSPLKGPVDEGRKKLLEILQKAIDGEVITKNEEFFLKNEQGELEFTLLAEGFRKLALLWILIQNGTLLNGAVLFWDEPETNLNPKLMRTVVEILIALQRIGVQIFLTTHNYSVLKEFDLQLAKNDRVLFHSLYRNSTTNEIEAISSSDYLSVSPNAIDDAYGSLVDREIDKSMGQLGK